MSPRTSDKFTRRGRYSLSNMLVLIVFAPALLVFYCWRWMLLACALLLLLQLLGCARTERQAVDDFRNRFNGL